MFRQFAVHPGAHRRDENGWVGAKHLVSANTSWVNQTPSPPAPLSLRERGETGRPVCRQDAPSELPRPLQGRGPGVSQG